MTHSNPDLTPTVIADKNGKITTVHKKNDAQQSSSVAKVPAPTIYGGIKSEKPSTASRIRGIGHALTGGSWGKPRQTKAEKLVKFSTPEQLDILDDALAGFDGASDHEQAVLASIFEPLTTRTGPTGTIHELLAHRKAFASEWAVNENPAIQIYGLEPFIHGLREDNFKTKLDCTDESVVNENIALIRFAYEVKERAPHGGFLPVHEAQIGVGGHTTAYAYDSDDLKTLIAENADRVDSLIDLALTHKNSDAQRLRALLEHEGHSSLTYGTL
jgi:hypothetical protein